MPATMNISLPEPLKKFVDGQVKQGGYCGVSDYVRDLIRDDQQRSAAQQLRSLIAEGLNSGAPVAVDKKYWAAKRQQFGA
jgi:antitoxin ParD1/3/4